MNTTEPLPELVYLNSRDLYSSEGLSKSCQVFLFPDIKIKYVDSRSSGRGYLVTVAQYDFNPSVYTLYIPYFSIL